MFVEDFVSFSLKLLEQEERVVAGRKENGGHLNQLRVTGHSTVYSHSVFTFTTPTRSRQLQSRTFTPGTLVTVGEDCEQNHRQVSGVVTLVLPSSLQVAIHQDKDTAFLTNSSRFCLSKVIGIDITFQRQKSALFELRQQSKMNGHCRQMVDVLFGSAPLSPPKLLQQDYQWINPGLNDDQKEAVRFALSQQELTVIHGPPGTGKTTTIVEIILQAVRQGIKVLAVAPSNMAVNNMVEGLAPHKDMANILRVGHPVRLPRHIQPFSLDAAVFHYRPLIDDGEKEGGANGFVDSCELELWKQCCQFTALNEAEVVLSTLASASSDCPLNLLNEGHFDMVIIDECAQAVEATCWIGLIHGRRCVLAGDPHQLPPTIFSKEAEKKGLGLTLMDRVIALHGDKVVRMLTTQYRMHQDIMQWSSQQFYHGRLTAHPSMATHLLSDLLQVVKRKVTTTPLLLLDTAGSEFREAHIPRNDSKANQGEVEVVVCHVNRLVAAGVATEDIAVITPYNLQVLWLQRRLSDQYPGLEIRSVDGFQGREKEAVILSFVRSNNKREVGFLAEKRRINVAITRARRHLAVICDSKTIGTNLFLAGLLNYIASTGQVCSAHHYLWGGSDPLLSSALFLGRAALFPRKEIRHGWKRHDNTVLHLQHSAVQVETVQWLEHIAVQIQDEIVQCLQHNTVQLQDETVQCLQHNTVQDETVQCLQHNTVQLQDETVQDETVQCLQHNTVQLQDETVQDETVQCLQHNTVQLQDETVQDETVKCLQHNTVQLQDETVQDETVKCLQHNTVQLQDETVQDETVKCLQHNTVQLQDETVKCLQHNTVQLQDETVQDETVKCLQHNTVQLQDETVKCLQHNTVQLQDETVQDETVKCLQRNTVQLQDETVQDETVQCLQHNTVQLQDETVQDETVQDETVKCLQHNTVQLQDETVKCLQHNTVQLQDETVQDETVQDETVKCLQHNTVQDETVQDETVKCLQHNTVQDETVQCLHDDFASVCCIQLFHITVTVCLLPMITMTDEVP